MGFGYYLVFKLAYGLLITSLVVYPWLLLATNYQRKQGNQDEPDSQSQNKLLRKLLLASFLVSLTLGVRALLDFYVLDSVRHLC